MCIDRDVPHSIDALGEDDIMINILINEETFFFSFSFLETKTSLVWKQTFLQMFLTSKLIMTDMSFFDTTQSIAIHSLIQLLLTEYWSYQHQGSEFLSHYIHLIMLELVRIYSIKRYKELSFL